MVRTEVRSFHSNCIITVIVLSLNSFSLGLVPQHANNIWGPVEVRVFITISLLFIRVSTVIK